jgi:hypothetical protein
MLKRSKILRGFRKNSGTGISTIFAHPFHDPWRLRRTLKEEIEKNCP